MNNLADHSAIAVYEAALRREPDRIDLLADLAATLAGLGRLAEALACWQRIVQRQPRLAAAHNNLGATLRQLQRRDEAVTAFEAALRLQPEYPEASCNLGSVLCELGRIEEGAAHLRRAVRIRPDYPKAHCNLGSALRDLGQTEAALSSFREALRLAPDFVEAHCHYGYLALRSGRLREGWESFEWRSRLPSAVRFPVPQPVWNGGPPNGTTLLVQAEEGFGDTIQFWRYVPLLAAAGHRVVFHAQPPLMRLLSGQDSGTSVVAIGDALPVFDRHCLLLSLPRIFGTTLESIPDAVPYLRADPALVARWQQRLTGLDGLRVGLVWQGSPHYAADERRSMRLDQLAPLAAVEGVAFVSLQKGAGPNVAPPHGMVLHDWTDQIADFADTAALIAALDLVIGVDTAVIHLAGALGKPVWLLNRSDTCWRWLENRDDSPWYPTLRQFRQARPGDWADVVGRVQAELQRLCVERRNAVAARYAEALRVHAADQFAEAEQHYRAVLDVVPDHDGSLHQLGVMALQLGRSEVALPYLGRAVRLRPTEAAYHVNLGNALRGLGSLAEAVGCYREALRLQPDNATCLSNLSNVLRDTGDVTGAEAMARQALAIQSDLPEAHCALAFALLTQGRLAEGWPEFRWRRGLPTYTALAHTAPPWQGEALGERGVLLFADEGFGDAIQCARYIPLVAARARVVVVVPPALVRLFATIAGPQAVVASGQRLPPHAACCALLDLPGVFGSGLADIPATVPYLRPAEAEVRSWRTRVQAQPGLKVGIAWTGNPLNPADGARSIPLGLLLSAIGSMPGPTLISLQKGPGSEALAETAGMAGAVIDWTPELNDFADTAALITSLDLVVSVDTAVAHLAGALGRPVWLLNRFDTCWRWLLHRDDSAWYPSLRQFRQPAPGDWAGALAPLCRALAERAAVDEAWPV